MTEAADPAAEGPPAGAPAGKLPATEPPSEGAQADDPRADDPQAHDAQPVDPPAARTPRWRLVAALTLPLVAVVAIIVGARLAGTSAVGPVGPLAVPGTDQPGAASASCKDLMSALPETLGGAERRTLAAPVDGVAAWGEPAVILRCGVPTPAELTCSASLQGVDTVDWLQLQGSGDSTYLAADRPVRVALTLPDGSGTAAIQEISRVVAGTIPERPVCDKGALLPTVDK